MQFQTLLFNMNFTSDFSKFGPIDLIYHWADQVFDVAQGMVSPDNVSDFFETVKWNEAFILALLTFQFALFAFTFMTRRYDLIQFAVLLFITSTTLAAERLNEYGRRNWSKFATQDYFDGPGLFMMVFISGPFVLLANIIVVCEKHCGLTL